MKLALEQRIQRAHVQIMRHPSFCLYSGVVMVGKVEVLDEHPHIKTAATNGRDVYYVRGFCDALSEKELNAVVLHENMHKAYRHLSMWESLWKQDPALANQACDYVSNQQLADADPKGEFLVLPPGALLDEQFRGMNAKQVFELLKKQGKGSGGGFDEHLWEEAQDMTEAEAQEAQKQIEDALRQGAIMVGKMGGKVDRTIGDLLNPKVDWREVLREFVTALAQGKDVSTWAKPNRRFAAQGMYLPSLQGETMGPIIVGVDTSGSIAGELLTQFLSEIVALCNTVCPEVVHLIYWDARVAGHEVYLPEQYDMISEATKPKGGGGTSPNCVPKYLVQQGIKPDAVIMLTDGYVDNWGNWSAVGAPLLWGVIGSNAVPDVGRSVKVEG